MNKSFKKASELLHSKNNIAITDELKERFATLNKAKIFKIYETSKPSKPSKLKETYERPSIKTLQIYVTTSRPENTKKKLQNCGFPDLKN
ncbi:12580_t:CDS:1, partial [Funneliformis geosporum]